MIKHNYWGSDTFISGKKKFTSFDVIMSIWLIVGIIISIISFKNPNIQNGIIPCFGIGSCGISIFSLLIRRVSGNSIYLMWGDIYVWGGLIKPKQIVVFCFSKEYVSNCTLDDKSMKVHYPDNQYKEVILSPFSHEDIQELINLLTKKCEIPVKISEQMRTQGYTCPEVPRPQNKRTTTSRPSTITEDRNAHSRQRQRIVSDNKETDNGPSLTQHRKRVVENDTTVISLDETDTSPSTTKRKRRLEF